MCESHNKEYDTASSQESMWKFSKHMQAVAGLLMMIAIAAVVLCCYLGHQKQSQLRRQVVPLKVHGASPSKSTSIEICTPSEVMQTKDTLAQDTVDIYIAE